MKLASASLFVYYKQAKKERKNTSANWYGEIWDPALSFHVTDIKR